MHTRAVPWSLWPVSASHMEKLQSTSYGTSSPSHSISTNTLITLGDSLMLPSLAYYASPNLLPHGKCPTLTIFRSLSVLRVASSAGIHAAPRSPPRTRTQEMSHISHILLPSRSLRLRCAWALGLVGVRCLNSRGVWLCLPPHSAGVVPWQLWAFPQLPRANNQP